MAKLINPADLKTVNLNNLTEADLKLTSSTSRLRFKLNGAVAGYDDTNIFYNLQNFKIKQGKLTKTPSSLAELKAAADQNNLFFVRRERSDKANRKGEYKTEERLLPMDYNKVEVIPLNFASTYISDNLNLTDLSSGSFLGQNRLMQQSAKENGKFIYACVNGKWNFYPKQDVGYYVGGEFKTLENANVDELRKISNRDLYVSSRYGNHPVQEMFDKLYTLDYVLDAKKQPIMDTISSDGLTATRYEIDTDGSGFAKYGDKYATNEEKLTRQFNEQSFRMLDDRAVMETVIYQAAANQMGDYIRINLRGRNQPIAVKVTGEDSQIYLADESGRPGQQVRFDSQDLSEKTRAISSIIGKEVLVKIKDGSEDKIMRSQPITSAQATLTYSTETKMQRTNSSTNYMADNAYLRLANGKYVKESEFVRPVAYKFVKGDESDFDAYCCYVKNRAGETITIIAPKNVKPNTNYKGYTILPSQMFKVKKSLDPLKDCDVIQTTNQQNSDVHQCVTLSTPQETETAFSTERKPTSNEDLTRAIQQFRAEYKQGNYQIDDNKVIVPVKNADGTVTNVALPLDVRSDNTPYRFIESDHFYRDDVTHNMDIYKYQRANPAFVDEKTGKLTKGPKFDAKAAIKDFYKKFGKVGLEVGSAFIIGGGPLIWLAAPILVSAVAAGYVATGIAAPFFYLAKSVYLKGKKFVDKVKENRKQTKKDLDKSMQALYEKMLTCSKQAKSELEKAEAEAQQQKSDFEKNFEAKTYEITPEIEILNRQLQALLANRDTAKIEELKAKIPNLEAQINESDVNLQFLNDNIYGNIIKQEGGKTATKKSLTDEDLDKLSKFLGISKEEFKNTYVITGANKLNKQQVLKDVRKKEKELSDLVNDGKKELSDTKKQLTKLMQTEKGISVVQDQIRAAVFKPIEDKLNAAKQQYATEMQNLRQFFANECEGDISTYIDMLGETKYNAEFEVQNKVAPVTEANAGIYSETRTELKKLAKSLKKVNRHLKGAPEDAVYLAQKKELETQRDSIINSQKSGKTYEADNEQAKYQRKLELLKSVVGIQAFGDTTLDEALDEAIQRNYKFKSASLKYTAKTDLKKSEIEEKQQAAAARLIDLGDKLYVKGADDEVVDYKVCKKVGDKYYSKNGDNFVELELEIVDDKPTIKSTRTLEESEAAAIVTALPKPILEKFEKLDESGIYEREKPIEEILHEPPKEEKPEPKKELSEEELKAKEAKEQQKKEMRKAIGNSTFQQEQLWKVIVYAKEIAERGEKAINDPELQNKIQFIEQYKSLVEKALKIKKWVDKNNVLVVKVNGREQTISAGLLEKTGENINTVIAMQRTLNSAK